MPNSNQDMQDQRTNPSMEDSAMTIEFLRARLLAERSVSRSARQRADELEKRVEELEEQLKIVSLQRKMAEKATADVLAILESQGISDTSEAFDSSSDQENQESQVGYNFANEEESSVFTKRRSDLEEFSGSDLDSSPVIGRSLSWKGRSNSRHSCEKYKDPSMRRRNTFSSISSSPKHCPGKSCRQIRHRDTRMVVEESKTEHEHPKSHSAENGVAASIESVKNSLNHRTEFLREGSEIAEAPAEGSLAGGVSNQRSTSCNGLDSNGHGRDRNMEEALEHKAQLIGQYKEMEKAQREWEEKFRENNTSTTDSCDPGNHSDITEERDEVKAQVPHPVETGDTKAPEVKSKESDVVRSKELAEPKSNGFLPHVDLGGAKDQTSSITGDAKHQAQEFAKANDSLPPSHDMEELKNQAGSNTIDSKFQTREFAFPTAEGKQTQEIKEIKVNQSPDNSHYDPVLHARPGNQSPAASSSDAGSSFHRGDVSGNQNDLYALVPHNPPHGLGGVLDALKNAKLSLQQKMNTLPLVEGTSIDQAIAPSVPETRYMDRMEVPIGCAGLFRLPTDYAVQEATSRTNLLGPGSRLPLSKFYPDKGLAATVTDQFAIAPYMQTTSSTFSSSDRFLSSNMVVSDSRVSSTLNSSFDPYLGTTPSSFNRYNNNYHTYPPYPTFPELMPQIPSNGVLSRNHSSSQFGTPADRLSFYDDHTRHNMYM